MSASYSRRKRRSALRRATRQVNSSQARGQRHRRRRRIIGPAIRAVYRMSRLLRPDMRVRYAARVTEGGIDREAWANVVLDLIAQETGTAARRDGNKSRFAELVGVTYKTVLRWTQGSSDVSEESVRQVARALHISPLELLFRVGYYTVEDLDAATRIASGMVDNEDDDPALRVILDTDLPPRTKQRLIQRLYQLRERDAERHVEDVRWWVDQAQGA